MSRFWFFLAMLCVPMIVGCEGCRRDDAAEKKKADEKEEAPKQDFTARPPQPFPSDGDGLGNAIKPGHWTSASQTLQSNRIDARGELTSVCGSRGVSLRSGLETKSVGTVPSIRPVVMPKGQRRRFDYRVLPPLPASSDQKSCFLTSQFTSSGQSLFFDTGSQPFRMMRAQEYFFIILTERPERFAKIKQGDWVRQFYDREEFELDPLNTDSIHYRIVIPNTDDVLPISDTMLDWTSTAVVLWDDLSADALTPDQIRAMSDWIQFGGRLIVNGAAGSDQVADTSINDWLPLKPTGNVELDPDAAVELLEGWQVESDRSTEKQIALVRNQSGRVAVDGTLSSEAEVLEGSGNLMISRRMGRGQIVQPRFDITSDWITDWNSYDSFVNSAILGRPKRTYEKGGDSQPIRQLYQGEVNGVATAATNSSLRLFSRDASLSRDALFSRDALLSRNESLSRDESLVNRDEGDEGEEKPQNLQSNLQQRLRQQFIANPTTGMSGWTDSSDVMRSFRSLLRSESGIEIPKSSLVVRSLGIYLLLLVPVNYLVFRLLGRLEYAWLAVPVIAIAGAIWVARAARLDIGFARSQNEIAMLELQPGYSRGHLTRVVAIYNSLSSTYDANFKTIDGCGVPIDSGVRGRDRRAELSDSAKFKSSFDEGPTLANIAIGSNQVRLIHGEQMVDIGGGIRLEQIETGDQLLVNDSAMDLQDVYMVRKTDEGETQIAILGGCAGGSSTKPRFQPAESVSVSSDLPMQTSSLIQRFASAKAMSPGAMRLVARYDGSLGGFSIDPTTNQQNAQTIVLVNLIHETLPKIEADENLVSEFRKINTLTEETP